MKDELNPEYIFSLTDCSLLIAIIKGDINPTILAIKELANRGLNGEGSWVGFDIANKIANKTIEQLN